MLNKKIKRTLCGLVASLCLVGSTVPVFAETVDFDVTVPGDILSPRAAKFDSEQRFYVTGTLFNKTGRLDCRSINRTNSAIQSRIASISPSYLSSRKKVLGIRANRRDFYPLLFVLHGG